MYYSSETPQLKSNSTKKFRISTWNVGTMKNRSAEIIETLSRRKIDKIDRKQDGEAHQNPVSEFYQEKTLTINSFGQEIAVAQLVLVFFWLRNGLTKLLMFKGIVIEQFS